MISDINIIIWNARGIKNKSIELFQFLIARKIHICLVSETWLKPHLSLNHQDFFVYRNDRELIRRSIIIKKNIPHKLLPIVNTNLIENIAY